MANQWFKFYGGEFLSDPKILQLTAEERSCWLTLLCLANQSDRGIVKFLSEKQLFALSGITKDIPNLLKKFEDLEMIHNRNGIVTIKNWEKRQMSEAYSRVQAFRKRKSNANLTIERKKERIERKKEEIELPIWLNKKAWDAWIKYLGERKKKITNSTLEFQIKKLSKDIPNHTEMIRTAIERGWVGFFPIKDNQNQKRNTPKRYEEPNDSKEVNERMRVLGEQSKTLAKKLAI